LIINPSNSYPYDSLDAFSIRDHAQKMIGKTFREIIDTRQKSILIKDEGLKYNLRNKGIYGLIAEAHFHITPNNIAAPDFLDAGIELKSSPLKKLKNGRIVSKERLVLSIINYDELNRETWDESTFLRKNSHLLLIFYLWKKNTEVFDFKIKLVDLWKFPPGDLKIIKDDWIRIQKKVKAGKAHKISDGDTLFLGACTKGGKRTGLRNQPNSDIDASQRAFNIKQKYLNFIIHSLANRWYGPRESMRWGYDAERIVKQIEEYQDDETFEELVTRRFKRHFGKTVSSLKNEFNLTFSNRSKQKAHLIAKAILGIDKTKKIEEFEKAEIEMKTITLENNGNLRESMSFPIIRYNDIVDQEFQESEIYKKLTKKFFFVIFKKMGSDKVLEKVMFWNMNNQDLEKYKIVFDDTKNKIKKGIYDDFIKISDNKIGHIRPHAQNSKDMMETPQGTFETKKCFWLNAKYIKSQIEMN